MKISGSKIEINGAWVEVSSSLQEASEVFGVEIDDGRIEIIEIFDEKKIKWVVSIFESNLYFLGSLLFEKEGIGWRFWSVEEEKKRKKLQDQLLKKWKIKKGNLGDLTVENWFDPKGGFSAISIQKS